MNFHDPRHHVPLLSSFGFPREPRGLPSSCLLILLVTSCLPHRTSTSFLSTSSGCSAPASLFQSVTPISALRLLLELWFSAISRSSSIHSFNAACECSPLSGANFVLFVALRAAPSKHSFRSPPCRFRQHNAPQLLFDPPPATLGAGLSSDWPAHQGASRTPRCEPKAVGSSRVIALSSTPECASPSSCLLCGPHPPPPHRPHPPPLALALQRSYSRYLGSIVLSPTLSGLFS